MAKDFDPQILRHLVAAPPTEYTDKLAQKLERNGNIRAGSFGSVFEGAVHHYAIFRIAIRKLGLELIGGVVLIDVEIYVGHQSLKVLYVSAR